MTSTIDIPKILLGELKALREKHTQFYARAKPTDKAARGCDEEARQKNVALKERIISLKSQLKQAKEAIEVTRITIFESLG